MKGFLKTIYIVFLITVFCYGNISSYGAEQITDIGSEPISSSQSPLADLNEIAKQMASFFPKVEGKILSINESIVKINVGTKNGITPQMRLVIFREGKEFIHPVTKVVMGRLETYCGLLEIKEVTEESALGVILEKKEGMNPGDRVRITSGRISVAVVSTGGVEKDTIEAFYDALEGTDRFRVLEDEKVNSALDKIGYRTIDIKAKEEIKKLGKALDIGELVFLEVKTTPTGPLLKADLVHAFDGKLVKTYEGFIVVTEKKEMELPFPERKDAWKTFDINYKARLLGIGDFDGDGRTEIVISDGTRLRIYRVEDSKLVELWADEIHRQDNHIAIDVADINRDGKAEIFVSNCHYELASFAIEFRNGDYKRIWEDLPLFFRVVNIPGKGETLLAQGLKGDIYEYSYKESSYVKGDRLKIPSSVSIYGFTLTDWERKGYSQVLFVDDDDYLNLYSLDGAMLWKSKDYYGGYSLSYEKPHVIGEEGKGEKIYVKGRIIIKDYATEGRQKAIVLRNIPFMRGFKNFKEGEIMSLSWNGSDMVRGWRIGKIDGYITDYGIGDLTNTGKESLCLLVNPTISSIFGKTMEAFGLSDFLSGKSRLLLYYLPKL